MTLPVRPFLVLMVVPVLATCGGDPVGTGAAISSISVSPAAPLLTALGFTQQFAASARDASGQVLSGITFNWTSSATGVASVESSGLVTAAGNGTSTITAAAGGVSGTGSVTVSQAVDVVTVAASESTLTAVGQTATIAVAAIDAGGAVVTGAEVLWSSSNPAVVSIDSVGIVTAVANGTATITATAGGIDSSVDITVNQVASQLAITQQPAVTVLSGVAFSQQPVVQVRDANGNNVAEAGIVVSVAIGSGGGALTGVTSLPTDGVGTVIFTNLAIVGASGARVLSFSSPSVTSVNSSNVNLASGLADPSQSTAAVPVSTVAGFSTTITVQTRDANGGALTVGGEVVAVAITGVNPSMPVMTDNGNGIYTAAYIPMAIGTDVFAVTLNGQVIANSPVSTIVGPGALDPTTSSVELPGGSIGVQTTISIQSRDAFGNQLVIGGATVSAIVTGANSDTATVADNANGTYSASYTPTAAGTDNIVITLNGSALGGSPFTNIITGDPDPTTSTAAVPTTGTAGTPTTIVVTARDVNGNAVVFGGATVVVNVSGTNSSLPTVIDNADGTYTANYTPTVTGSDNVAITLNGGTIVGSPFVTAVGAGAAVAAQTTAQVPAAGAVGAVTSMAVTARDGFGNALTSGGSAVAVSVTGANAGTLPITDNGDGTYSANYTPAATGTDNIAITLDGGAVMGSPFTSVLGAGAADAAQSTASVPAAVNAGTTNTVTVTSRDPAGNVLTSGGEIVLISVVGANPAALTVGDNGDGSYSATYAPTVLGTDTIAVTLNGIGLGNSPLLTVVAPGPLDPANSTAVVPNGTVAQLTSIVVQARDQFNNPVPTGGSAVVVNVTGANPGSLPVTDNGDGTYAASYTPATAGTDAVAITVDGTNINASPYTSTVSSGTIDPASTTVVLLTSIVAGELAPIVVTARDAAGNPLTIGGATVAVAVAGSNPVSPPVTDVGDGTYTTTYVPVVAGSDNVTITIDGAGIGGSPFAVTVTPGAVDPSRSTAVVPANGAAGMPTTIQVTVRDSLNNQQVSGGANVVVSVSGANNAAPPVTDNGDGTYTAAYTPGVPGTDLIAVSINGVPIPGSPFSSVIGSGAAVAAQTTATVPPAGAAGTPTPITIQGRDALGNVVTTGGDIVSVTVTGSNNATPTVIDNGDGTYAASYTPTVLGPDNVVITLNGTSISGSPFSTTVAPGAPDPTRSTAVVPANSSAGIPINITVQTRDALSNPLTTGGATIVITVVGANPTALLVTDNGDGTYAATHTPTSPGTDNVGITMGGTPIAGSPYTITVTPGLPDPAQSTASVPPAAPVGSVTLITVTARDASGNPVGIGGQTVVIVVSGANTATPSVFDLGDGRYDASYIPVFAGLDSLTITMNGAPVGTSPYVSTITSGTLDPTETTAAVPVGTAGLVTSIVVQARDGFTNPIAAVGQVVGVTVTGANTANPTVLDNGNGTYTATYLPTNTGFDNIAITMNGTASKFSPYSSVVSAGAVNAAQTTATVPGGNAGTITNIVIQARDGFGNPVATGGSNVVVTVSGANTAGPTVTDGGNGTYTASYTPTVTGADNVVITLDGGSILGSPFTSNVTAGTADPAQSTASVPSNGTAGSLTTITVTSRDAAGNLLTTGGASVVFTITGANTSNPLPTDVGNGTYTASYTPISTGTDIVNITLNGGAISGSPYTSLIGAGNVNGALSTATAPASLVAGNASVITVQTRDANGNIVTSGGATVVVSVTGSNTASPGVMDNGNGTYTSSYTPTVAGTDNITITVNGTALNTSPLSTTITPGVVAPASSTSDVPAAASAGTVVTYTITTRDQFGNAVGTGGNVVVVNITGANTATPTVFDNGNGRYNASYIPANAGTDNVIITMNSVSISGSPYTTSVTASSLDPAKSTATVPVGSAGTPTQITVQSRDAFGNPVTTSGQVVTITVTGANTAAPSVSDNGDGTYSASYVPTTAGSDFVAITMNSIAILGSPYFSTVTAGAVNGAQSTATVPAGTSGSSTVITVQARDVFGNALTTGGASVLVSISGVNTGNPTVIDLANGTYTASYTPAATGTDNVAITLNGTPVSGSPYVSVVSAGGASAPMSTATVPAGTAGTPTNITVVTRDAAGNPLTTGGAIVTLSVSGSNIANPFVTDVGNGTYTTSYTPTVAGLDNVAITLNGAIIGGSPYSSVVTAGAASGTLSTATVPGAVTAGTVSVTTVQTRDASGNLLTVGGAAVTVTVSGANTASPLVTDNNNGTYTATYTPTITGIDNVALVVNGTSPSASPYASSIGPSTVNPGLSTANVPASTTAGNVVTYAIVARDGFGNALTTGGHAVVVTITGSNTVTPTVFDNANGTYTASYIPTVVGSDNVVITLNGTPISGSPFTTTVN